MAADEHPGLPIERISGAFSFCSHPTGACSCGNKSGAPLAEGCIVLWVRISKNPEKGFFFLNDNFRVCKETYDGKSSCYKLPTDACVCEEAGSGERAGEGDADGAEMWDSHK